MSSIALPSPSPHSPRRLTRQAVRFASSSSSRSVQSASMPPSASSRSTSSDDQAQNSSDDEYGVFLGAHDPFENQLVSKLSNSSPLHSTSRLRQKPVLIQKLRKRDSREFLRRKTLSSSAKDEPETNENVRSKGKERTWEGGFYEKMDRRGSESYSSTSDPPSPEVSGQLPVYSDDITTPSQWARISGHSDLTLDFSAFYLTETPPTSVSSVDTEHSDRESTLQGCAEGRKGVVSGEDEYTEDGPGNSEQEKGSLPMLLDMERSKEKARLIVDTDFKLELGARDPEENEADGADDVKKLDMGGLHLSDFSDPETGFADDMRAVVEANDFKSDDVASIVDSGDYGEAQDHKLSHDHHANSSEEEHDYLENENQMKLTISATDISSTELASELEVSEHFRTPSASRIAAPAERTPSSLSTEYDSPLPIARAGPVIIPHIGSHYLSSQTIRADPGSPFRSLPFNSSPIGQIESMGAFTPDVTIRLGRIDSPESPKKPASQMPLTIQQTPLISSMHKALLPADATPPAARHPVSYTRPGVIETNSKTLKSSVGQATTIIPVPSDCMKSAARPGKVVARALAVRVQLDAAFQSKLGSMGPPQRAVSSSSVSSSASSSSISQQNSVARNGMTAPSKASQYASNKMDSSKLAKLNAGPTNPIGNPRTPATLPQNLVRGSNRPPTNCGRFTSQPKVRTSVASIACQHKSAVPLLSTKAASRPALAPRAIPQCVVRTTEAHTNASKMARPPLEPNASIPNIEAYKPLACSPQAVQLNTLKRPLPISQPTMGRPLVTASGKPVMRPTLGLPSRLGREGTATRLMPVFSLGAAGGNESGTPGRSGIKSPHRPILARPATNNSWGTPSDLRLTKLGTPRRAIGTPDQSRMTRRPMFVSNATSSNTTHEVAMHEPSTSYGPPASATRHASGSQQPVQRDSTEPQRGSSQDQEDVSFQLEPAKSADQDSSVSRQTAPRLPIRFPDDDDVERKETLASSGSDKAEKPSSVGSKRMARPAQSASQRGRQAGRGAPSIVTDMSEKELKATTQHNTIRNQVYLCAIDRQIVRKLGPRPPSPSSKIPTTADRDEAERKAGRGERAKRRLRSPDVDSDREESDGSVDILVTERISHVRGPGEEEDYTTPLRPGKKVKMSHEQSETPKKSVTWDKGLVVIRRREGEGVSQPPSRRSSVDDSTLSKGCLRDTGKVELDLLGNVVELTRPQEKLKRTRIVVTAVFYDGEEPVPPPGTIATSGGKGRKK